MNPKKPGYDEEFSRNIEYAEHYSNNNVETRNGKNREEVREDTKNNK